MSASGIDDNSTDHADSRKQNLLESQYNWNMYFYGREICFFLAVVFTSYAALKNAPPKISKIMPAIPFFPRESYVTDFYQGELSPAFEKISESDLSFVLYYAPWDAECQAVKSEFNVLASYYRDQVYFAAVNCWHPTGECRRHFAKVQQYPVLIAYPALRGKGVQYRGIRKAPHMARFLKSALRPLYRVEAASDVFSLLASHDAVAVGCVDLSNRVRGYQAFYTAALRALEKDPFQEVAFAVATSKIACQRVSNASDVLKPTLRLHLWNETLMYDGEWTGDALVKWVFSSIHQVAVWVSLPGTKSYTLAPYVEEGPALLLFTPRNPFYSDYPYFELLREVGLEYYNCNNSSWVNRLAQYLGFERKRRKQRHRNAEKACFSSLLREGSNVCFPTTEIPTCTTVVLPGTANLTVTHKEHEHNGLLSRGWSRESQDEWNCRRVPWTIENCLIPSIRDVPLVQVGNITSQIMDGHVIALSKKFREQRCRNLLLGRRLQRAVFPKQSSEEKLEKLNGLACANNRSLALLALDSLEFHSLAERLGVDVLNRPDRTAVIIFNTMQETQHVLEGPLNKKSLAQFLMNHTDGLLTRTLRSLSSEPLPCPENTVCISELNTTTFLPTVLQNDKDVVVLYHSPYCGLCGSASLAFLAAARLFDNTPRLQFARIDGDNNDLPWEFTMDTFPTVIFFPAMRKAESRVFPFTKSITVETLSQFVLANLKADSRLHALLGLHDGSPAAARLHIITALHEVLAQRRKMKAMRGPGAILHWRRLLQRSQYLRLLHLAFTEESQQQVAAISLHQYHSLPPSHSR